MTNQRFGGFDASFGSSNEQDAAQSQQDSAHARFHDLVYKQDPRAQRTNNAMYYPDGGPQYDDGVYRSGGPMKNGQVDGHIDFGRGYEDRRHGSWKEHGRGGHCHDERESRYEESRGDHERWAEHEGRHRRGGGHGHGHGHEQGAEMISQNGTDMTSYLQQLESNLRANGNETPQTLAAIQTLENAIASNSTNVPAAAEAAQVQPAAADTSALANNATSANNYLAYGDTGVGSTGTAHGAGAQSDGQSLGTSAMGSDAQSGATAPAGTDSQAGSGGGLSPAMLTAAWASANGMDPTDQTTYAKLTTATDGTTQLVGPYQLNPAVVGSFVSNLQGSNGQIDQSIVNQMVQSGEISQATAQSLSSPAFQQFVNDFASGKATADQVTKNMPADLQNAIATESVIAVAQGQARNGAIDPGQILLELKLGRNLQQADLQDQTNQAFLQQIDGSLQQQMASTTTDQTGSSHVASADQTGPSQIPSTDQTGTSQISSIDQTGSSQIASTDQTGSSQVASNNDWSSFLTDPTQNQDTQSNGG